MEGGLSDRALKVLRGVLHIYVRHFVPHDTCELGFVSGSGDGSDVDKHRSARECERVDLFLRDNVKLERPGVLRWDGGDQLLPELTNVLCFGTAVGQDRHLLINLGRGLQAQGALVFAGHVSIAGIGEFRTGGFCVGLGGQQQRNQA